MDLITAIFDIAINGGAGRPFALFLAIGIAAGTACYAWLIGRGIYEAAQTFRNRRAVAKRRAEMRQAIRRIG